MTNAPKNLIFLGDSLDAIRGFGRPVSLEAGRELRRVQNGAEPRRWKPMSSIGTGVREIRISHEGEYRVLYVVRREDVVFVLHAFRKKSRRTSREDIAKARLRLKCI